MQFLTQQYPDCGSRLKEIVQNHPLNVLFFYIYSHYCFFGAALQQLILMQIAV